MLLYHSPIEALSAVHNTCLYLSIPMIVIDNSSLMHIVHLLFGLRLSSLVCPRERRSCCGFQSNNSLTTSLHFYQQ